MLTAIYYSEKRDNIILVQPSNTTSQMVVISGLMTFPTTRSGSLNDRELLIKEIKKKDYKLIGFYNE
jgi:hypothetical protein